jgi:hypothetical protein
MSDDERTSIGKILKDHAQQQAEQAEAEDAGVGTCRVCGCTDEDCSDCVKRTGAPCWWVEADLCSACQAAPAEDEAQAWTEVDAEAQAILDAMSEQQAEFEELVAGWEGEILEHLREVYSAVQARPYLGTTLLHEVRARHFCSVSYALNRAALLAAAAAGAADLPAVEPAPAEPDRDEENRARAHRISLALLPDPGDEQIN